jgi:signal transduction histidine kinase
MAPPCRPPWWPDEEPWTPGTRFRGHRGPPARLFRGLAAIVALTLFVGFAGMVALIWIAATRLGATALTGTASAALSIGLTVAIALAVIAVGRTFRRVRHPLESVMEAADHVAAGDYSTRVPEQGPPAIRGLIRAFNTMTERLESHDRLRRDLMADVAHELRTPLSVMRGKIEGMLDGVYPWNDDQLHQLLEETEVLSRLVEDLRTLALSESGALKLEREPTDLAALANDVRRAFADDAEARGVALHVDAAPDVAPISVDPVRIREVIGNLVSNATRYTPVGGSVTVRIAPGRQDEVVIEVRDTGRGMAQAEVARAFDRFYKGDGSRGSGLGLTIAKGLVEAHGGDIRASSEPGRGTTITVVIPRTA